MDFSVNIGVNFFVVLHKNFFVSLNIGNTVRWATVAARLLYITAELEPFGLKGINSIDFFCIFQIIYVLQKSQVK